jgi:hypothetical protein
LFASVLDDVIHDWGSRFDLSTAILVVEQQAHLRNHQASTIQTTVEVMFRNCFATIRLHPSKRLLTSSGVDNKANSKWFVRNHLPIEQANAIFD